MRTGLAMVVMGLCVLAVSGTASADPNGPNVRGVFDWNCDGQIVRMEAGPAGNNGRVAWVVNSTSALVVKYTAVTDGVDTFVFFDSTHGDTTGLVTCTTPGRPGDTFIAKGFFTAPT